MKASRPYLQDRRCGCCRRPFEISERRDEDGWCYVTYICARCSSRTVVTFSPAELAEWQRRGHAGAGP